MTKIDFPTELHEEVVTAVRDFFLNQKNVDTVALVNSLARGKATADSDIDMAVLVSQTTTSSEITALNNIWDEFSTSDEKLNRYKKSNKFALLHLDIIDGVFEPAIWEEGGGIDFFEVEIGNRLLYSLPVAREGEFFTKLKLKWLPYYDLALQGQRLKLSREACLYEIDHIPLLVQRGLYFHAFDRLYTAFQKFLQTLFIKHKTYPIAYNKWIKEQVVGLLGLEELYNKLPNIISVTNIVGDELNDKAKALHALLDHYI